MHNEALVASYANQVAHTICPNLSPIGYVATGLPLALVLLVFDA